MQTCCSPLPAKLCTVHHAGGTSGCTGMIHVRSDPVAPLQTSPASHTTLLGLTMDCQTAVTAETYSVPRQGMPPRQLATAPSLLLKTGCKAGQ